MKVCWLQQIDVEPLVPPENCTETSTHPFNLVTDAMRLAVELRKMEYRAR